METNITNEELQANEEKVAKLKTEFLSDSINQIGALECAGRVYEYCMQKNYPIPSKDKLVELVVRLASVHGETFDHIETEIKTLIDNGNRKGTA